jgi:hypothetical protein
MSQKEAVLRYLKTKRQLTPLEALRKFGCARLASRIYELREEGHRIHGVLVDRGGKHVASYLLIKAKKAA